MSDGTLIQQARRVRPVRGAFTLVEILISLAITATLLAAMAMAFTAAGSAVEVNDRYFRSVQQARTAMDLILTQIRRCQAITSPAIGSLPSTANFSTITLTADSGDFSGHSVTFAYNNGTAASNPNTVTITDNSTSAPARVMASNVVSVSFNVMPGLNSSGNPAVAAVGLTLTVQIPEEQMTLSGSACPRVNLVSLYQ
jgi:type II secretory pathway pseudopilin PulG